MKRYLNLNGISWTLDGDIDRAVSVRPLAQKMMFLMKMQNVNNLDHVWFKHTMDDGTVIRLDSRFGRDSAYIYCEPRVFGAPMEKKKKIIRRFVPAFCCSNYDGYTYWGPEYSDSGDIIICVTPLWTGNFGVVQETSYPQWVTSREEHPPFVCDDLVGRAEACDDWGYKYAYYHLEGRGTSYCEDSGAIINENGQYLNDYRYIDSGSTATYSVVIEPTATQGVLDRAAGNIEVDGLPGTKTQVYRYRGSRDYIYNPESQYWTEIDYDLDDPWYFSVLKNNSTYMAFAYIEDACPKEAFHNLHFSLFASHRRTKDYHYENDIYVSVFDGCCCDPDVVCPYAADVMNAPDLQNTGPYSYQGDYILFANVNGVVVEVDRIEAPIDTVGIYDDYFSMTDIHILDADGIPVYMYAYHACVGGENYKRYGYFYGNSGAHFQSEKYSLIPVEWVNRYDEPQTSYIAHNVTGSEALGVFVTGKCAGYMIEEEIEVN